MSEGLALSSHNRTFLNLISELNRVYLRGVGLLIVKRQNHDI